MSQLGKSRYLRKGSIANKEHPVSSGGRSENAQRNGTGTEGQREHQLLTRPRVDVRLLLSSGVKAVN